MVFRLFFQPFIISTLSGGAVSISYEKASGGVKRQPCHNKAGRNDNWSPWRGKPYLKRRVHYVSTIRAFWRSRILESVEGILFLCNEKGSRRCHSSQNRCARLCRSPRYWSGRSEAESVKEKKIIRQWQKKVKRPQLSIIFQKGPGADRAANIPLNLRRQHKSGYESKCPIVPMPW